MFPRLVRACGWFACNTRHDCTTKVNTLESEQNMEIYNNEVEHTWKQLIASSTLPASLSALPYER